MSSSWQRVQDVFDVVVDLPEAERAAYLETAFGDDVALRDEVLSLLEADASAPSFLDGMAAGSSGFMPQVALDAAALEAVDLTDLSGQEVGRYRLVSMLGSGGMGAVYLARRSDGAFEQEVALKIIKLGMDSTSVLARFQAERQILARLRHPNIATLLDGGLTADGRPYFTMEYVDGVPVDEYCRRHELSLCERLALFVTICEAVQYAQNNLVIHRDLKPGNIFVTADGTVKLMDFGIAKLMTGEAGGGTAVAPATALTRTGLQVMTPGYAAPEQIRGEPVNTATDVFALGVVLYELLTGERPFGGEGTSQQELLDSICNDDPERPSRRRPLAGDLDNISLKALRREPERRYNSPGRLADDIERYLNGRPVLARSATFGYRSSKFLQRHRRAVGAVTAVVAVAVALVAFYTGRLAEERDQARLEAARAAQVTSFMTSLFAVADPEETRGADLTARELLARGARRARTGLSDQPAVQAAMLDVVGKVYHGLGLYAESDSLLREAVALKRELYGGDDLEYAFTAGRLGALLRDNGAPAAAESLLTLAVVIQRRELSADDPRLAVTLNNLGQSYDMYGDSEQAEPLFREALAIWDHYPAEQHPESASCRNNLALLLLGKADHEAAEALFRQAVDEQRRWLGDDHPEVATTLFNLALLLRDRGDFAAAEPIQRQVLTLDRQLYGESHPYVAHSLSSMGFLLREQGKYEEAEEHVKAALAMRRELLPPEHPDIASSVTNLGLVRHQQGDYTGAEPFYRQALELTLTHRGESDPHYSGRLNKLGWLYYDMGRYEESAALHRRSLELSRVQDGDVHKGTGISLMQLSRALCALGQLDEAQRYQEEALAIARTVYGDDNLFTAANAAGMASILLERGEIEEARTLADSSQAVLGRLVAADHPRMAAILQTRARILQAEGSWQAAEISYRQALEIRGERLGETHPITAWTQISLAGLLVDLGRAEEAGPLASQGLAALREGLPEDHPRVGTAEAIAARSQH